MRRLGLSVASVAMIAAATSLVGYAPVATAAPTAGGGCGWQNTLANLNTPDGIRAGTLRLSGYAPVHLDLTGNIDWTADPYRDPTWRLWFHSLKWIESLVTSGQPEELALARRIVAHFVAANPDPGRDEGPWVDHATSFRTSVLVCMWQKGAADPEFRAWLEPILRKHASVVAHRYVGPWNHGTMQSLALLAAGCTLDEPSWRTLAAGRLRDELVKSVDTQGAISEQAPGYAAFIQRLHREARAHLKACEMPAADSLYARLGLVDTFAAHATRPDGTFVELGDTWPERPTAALGPHSAWVGSGGTRGTQPAELVKVYNAGFVFARDSWTTPTQQYTLRFGPGRYGHGHKDHLSMTYWSKGRDVLVDSGYAGYADWPFRMWSRSLQAHNVPIVSGAKFDAGASTRLVGSHAGKGVRSWQLRDRAFAGAERHRSVLVDEKLKVMLVRDDVTADRARGLQILWHLDPIWSKERVDVDGPIATTTFRSGAYRTTVIQLAPPHQELPSRAAKLIRGQNSPAVQGWVSRHRGDRTPNWVVEARRGAAKRQSVITLIVVTRVGEKVRAVWNQPNGKNRIRVTVGDHTRVYDSTRRGNLSAR